MARRSKNFVGLRFCKNTYFNTVSYIIPSFTTNQAEEPQYVSWLIWKVLFCDLLEFQE